MTKEALPGCLSKASKARLRCNRWGMTILWLLCVRRGTEGRKREAVRERHLSRSMPIPERKKKNERLSTLPSCLPTYIHTWPSIITPARQTWLRAFRINLALETPRAPPLPRWWFEEAPPLPPRAKEDEEVMVVVVEERDMPPSLPVVVVVLLPRWPSRLMLDVVSSNGFLWWMYVCIHVRQ